MVLWLMACGEEPKGEPEVETPTVLDVSAQIQPYLESSGAPALGTARIQGDSWPILEVLEVLCWNIQIPGRP